MLHGRGSVSLGKGMVLGQPETEPPPTTTTTTTMLCSRAFTRLSPKGETAQRCGPLRLLLPMTLVVVVLMSIAVGPSLANPDAKRLYDDLLSHYNRLIRPVGNNSDRLTVRMGLKLSQLIEVNLKSQIMTTNVWVEQVWQDYKLVWEPSEYGGVTTLHVPSEQIWLPDIALYNNADGNYEVTIMTKAILHNDGMVIWKPPAIYKSSCNIDVEYFPFDQQTCQLKFGSWTYDGYMVDLKHLHEISGTDKVEIGIDLHEFYLSVEWDIMAVPAIRNEKFYSCCDTPYPDITFNITLRRKTLFYTVNLIIPCLGISFLSVLVFYLPSDSGEKVSLCISILLSLTVFFLLLVEIIPPTSLTVPLLGKYLLFTMVLVTLSVGVTIAVLNVNFRSPSTHKMAPWVRKVFIHILPCLLFIRRPDPNTSSSDPNQQPSSGARNFNGVEVHDSKRSSAEFEAFQARYSMPVDSYGHGHPPREELLSPPDTEDASPSSREKRFCPELERAIQNVHFIAQHLRNQDDYDQIEQDWKYVALVLDRLFLVLFTSACLAGTGCIILQAPSLYDDKLPIDIALSKIAQAQRT